MATTVVSLPLRDSHAENALRQVQWLFRPQGSAYQAGSPANVLRPMTSSELAMLLFTACNAARVLAYVPQIAAVARDTNGASAISYTTWSVFAVSNLSTVGYAVLVAADWNMAAIFALNFVACIVILGLTVRKRIALEWY